MFENLNLEEKIKITARVNDVCFLLTAVLSGIGFYKIELGHENYIHWCIIIAVAWLVDIVIVEILRKWIHNTISSPIYDAVIHTSMASNKIVESTTKQEDAVNKHLKLLNNAADLVKKLSFSSNQTKICAEKVSEKSQEALIMSSKEQEAVKANIEKMRTLKQKIEIIAKLILELSEHTQQIGSIIGVVEDITEQTNMLALNAAVEAARAGEHGKGFAVVASEIRKLADESKQATTKISALIHDIQQATNSTVMATEEGTKEIESGVDLAHQIATSIDVLRNMINETVKSVDEIVGAANNQSICTQEVTEAIDSINTGMVESSTMIKQSLTVLKGLINVADTLKDNVIGNSESREAKNYKNYSKNF